MSLTKIEDWIAAPARVFARRFFGGGLLLCLFFSAGCNANSSSTDFADFKNSEPCRFLTLETAQELAGQPLELIYQSAPDKTTDEDFADAAPLTGNMNRRSCVYAEPRDDYQNQNVTEVELEIIDFKDEPEAHNFLRRTAYGYNKFLQKTAARLGDDSITLDRDYEDMALRAVEVITRKSNLVFVIQVSRFDRKQISIEKVEATMRKVLDDLAAE